MRFARLLIGLIALVLLPGCGDGAKTRDLPKAPVSGIVSYGGQPLTAGAIVFMHETGENTAAELGAEGKYSAQVPIGKNKVLVTSREPESTNPNPEAAAPKGLPGKSRIPEKYNDYGTSGLAIEVKEGENKLDAALTD